MTFAELVDETLAYTKRPASDTTIVKSQINKAQLWAQRSHNFEKAKMFIGTVYKASEPENGISLGLGGDLQVKTVLSARIGEGSLGYTEGDPLELLTWEEFSNREEKFLSTFGTGTSEVSPTLVTQTDRFSQYVEQNYGVLGLINAASYLRLFPAPSTTKTINLYVVHWLPKLVNDNDTNFLLEFGNDVLLYKTLSFFNTFLKADERVELSAALLRDSWHSLLAWDASLTSSWSIHG